MVGLDVLVVVPRLARAAPNLDEAHAALEQAAGDQELPGLGARAVLSRIDSGLPADVKRLRRLASACDKPARTTGSAPPARVVSAARGVPFG